MPDFDLFSTFSFNKNQNKSRDDASTIKRDENKIELCDLSERKLIAWTKDHYKKIESAKATLATSLQTAAKVNNIVAKFDKEGDTGQKQEGLTYSEWMALKEPFDAKIKKLQANINDSLSVLYDAVILYKEKDYVKSLNQIYKDCPKLQAYIQGYLEANTDDFGHYIKPTHTVKCIN